MRKVHQIPILIRYTFLALFGLEATSMKRGCLVVPVLSDVFELVILLADGFVFDMILIYFLSFYTYFKWHTMLTDAMRSAAV